MARRKKDEQTAELPFEENDNSQSRIVQVSREGFLTSKDFGAEDVVDNPSYLPRGLVLANLPYKKLYKSDGSIETNYVQETKEVTLACEKIPFRTVAAYTANYLRMLASKQDNPKNTAKPENKKDAEKSSPASSKNKI